MTFHERICQKKIVRLSTMSYNIMILSRHLGWIYHSIREKLFESRQKIYQSCIIDSITGPLFCMIN